MLIHASSICISPIEKNPQHDSGIANKVFQYMLFEKPVLVSNCTPQEDLIKSTDCGLVFESGNRKDFADKTLELYQNDSLRVSMGINGKKAILKTYNLVNYGKKISALYTD
jgi:glycosyltransferase involved in cell wall biosynthesis